MDTNNLLLSPLCIPIELSMNYLNVHPMNVNCDKGLKKEYFNEVLRGGPKIKTPTWHRLLLAGATSGLTSSSNRGRDLIVPLRSKFDTNFLYPYFPILTSYTSWGFTMSPFCGWGVNWFNSRSPNPLKE